MNVAGIGLVFTRGRGLDAFETALRDGWVPPERREVEKTGGTPVPVYPVSDETLRDRQVLAKMRRADRFTRMSVLAACDALVDSGLEVPRGSQDIGILLASGLGAHATGFRFLGEMLEFGEATTSPTLFSRSVQNAAASHIALRLGTRGPSATLTQFHFSFHEALVLADAWIEEGRCSHVLVGATEELGCVMEYVCQDRLRLAESGRIEPLGGTDRPEAVPGEGSVFFLVTRDASRRRYGDMCVPRDASPAPDLALLDADGLTRDETSYGRVEGAVASHVPLFGSMMTGTAFHAAAAALVLRNRAAFASPVTKNPHGLLLATADSALRLETVDCVRHDCDGAKRVVRVCR